MVKVQQQEAVHEEHTWYLLVEASQSNSDPTMIIKSIQSNWEHKPPGFFSVFVPRTLSDHVMWLSKQLISPASTADRLRSPSQ